MGALPQKNGNRAGNGVPVWPSESVSRLESAVGSLRACSRKFIHGVRMSLFCDRSGVREEASTEIAPLPFEALKSQSTRGLWCAAE